MIVMIFCMIICFLPYRRHCFGSCWGYFDKSIGQNDIETPIELLKKRYAKGEITSQEFEKIKREIQN